MIMNAPCNKDEHMHNVSAIDMCENENGASNCDSSIEQFGRRIEVNGSWTIYHVYSGIPAVIKGITMTDLSYAIASEVMIALNKQNVRRQGNQSGLSCFRRMG